MWRGFMSDWIGWFRPPVMTFGSQDHGWFEAVCTPTFFFSLSISCPFLFDFPFRFHPLSRPDVPFPCVFPSVSRPSLSSPPWLSWSALSTSRVGVERRRVCLLRSGLHVPDSRTDRRPRRNSIRPFEHDYSPTIVDAPLGRQRRRSGAATI